MCNQEGSWTAVLSLRRYVAGRNGSVVTIEVITVVVYSRSSSSSSSSSSRLIGYYISLSIGKEVFS